ncbi:RICIN domain-containing protein [Kitasatospora sp. NPDC093550]|uniref:RICIN domain-containing protein n=1 Tax=Kitasatospora sp. NPDC093550 TaxID=3364089 RepID=UPI0038169C26
MTLRRTTTERTGRTTPSDPRRDRPGTARAAAVLLPGLLPGLLLIAGCTGGPGPAAGPSAAPGVHAADNRAAAAPPEASPAGPEALSDDVLPGGLGDPATAPTGTPAFDPDGPRTPSYGGLGTLASCASGRRLAVLDAPPSDVPDGAPVGTVAPTGGNGEEWLVWTEPDGGLALQSLLSSGAPVPRLITVEPTGTVAVRDDTPAGATGADAQRWQFTDRRPAPDAAPADGSVTDCLLIRTQDGTRCLLDQGADAPLTAGACSSPLAWWRPQGLTGPTGT